MPQQSDQESTLPQLEPKQDTTLPQPELNPLVNALLAQNMGRWAEVYFTAPPENRDQAVLALLRELESQQASKPEHPVSKENPSQLEGMSLGARGSVEFPPPQPADGIPPKPRWVELSNERSVVCPSCGQSIPETQRFCGMCGSPMRRDSFGVNVNHSDNALAGNESPQEFTPVDVEQVRETLFSFGRNVPESVEGGHLGYRVYILGAVVVLIGALMTMAYRRAQDWSGTAHSLPQAVAPTADASAPAPLPPPVSKQSTPDVTPKNEPERNSVPPAAPARQAVAQKAELMQLNPSVTNQGNGSEELHTAERYLNGTGGSARDTSAAAHWLWQAVGKKNAAASLLLSDLYLRGDGVPKNCDQARLLLDAAAKKGTPGAGERLRNLQAFGCR